MTETIIKPKSLSLTEEWKDGILYYGVCDEVDDLLCWCRYDRELALMVVVALSQKLGVYWTDKTSEAEP